MRSTARGARSRIAARARRTGRAARAVAACWPRCWWRSGRHLGNRKCLRMASTSSGLDIMVVLMTLLARGRGSRRRWRRAPARQPQHVDRQEQQVQHQHRAQVGQHAVGDEGQVAGDGHAAQRHHAAHAERGQHQRRGEIADGLDRRSWVDAGHAVAVDVVARLPADDDPAVGLHEHVLADVVEAEEVDRQGCRRCRSRCRASRRCCSARR